MDELEEAVGREFAPLLGGPAAYVTSGAAAALTPATALCVTGDTPGAIDQLPSISGSRRRVLTQRVDRDPCDHTVTSVGVKLTAISYPGSTRPDELQRELDETLAAVLWRPGRVGDLLSLCR